MPHPTNLTAEDFRPLEGDTVTVEADGIEIEATLLEIKTGGSALREGGGFALLFQGPVKPSLPQATYQVTHAAIGTQHLFLVPVAKTKEGYQYEAVFT
jgi:hypothetical protein